MRLLTRWRQRRFNSLFSEPTMTFVFLGKPVGRLCAAVVLVLIFLSSLANAGDEANPREGQIAEEFDRERDLLEPGEIGLALGELIAAVDWDAASEVARDQLLLILQKRLDLALCAGELTDGQHDKLLLAGRGDISRLLDRVWDWKRRYQRVRRRVDAANPLDDLRREATTLEALLISGPFDEKSIFAKTMRHSLTSEQRAHFEIIRRIERDGGRITADGEGSDRVAGICLTDAVTPGRSLASLEMLKNLRHLSLDSAQISDADLVHLERLSRLEHLDLSRSLVTDQGLVHLQNLTRLKTLRLNRTQVTGAGFEHLRGLTDLEDLSIAESEADDEGLVHLVSLSGLRSLDISGTRITDTGVEHLRHITGLERLRLDRTDVTDTGLDTVKRLKDLEFLSCRQTGLTHDGIGTLRRWRRSVIVED
jgi:Leucine-rich repeat (LRR) protein